METNGNQTWYLFCIKYLHDTSLDFFVEIFRHSRTLMHDKNNSNNIINQTILFLQMQKVVNDVFDILVVGNGHTDLSDMEFF